jgi:error-prone DNA polymerase
MYGVVRFSEAARALELPTIFGAELSLGLPGPQNGVPDPAGRHLLVLARGPAGYARLSSLIGHAHLAGGEKGRPVYDLEQVAADLAGHGLVLTGCRKGHVPAALYAGDPAGELDRLVALFGAQNVAVELTHHGHPEDDERNDALADLAGRAGLPTVATGNVHYAVPARRRLATALAAVRARRSLDELDGWLPAAGVAHLRSGAEMAARFAAFPGAVARAAGFGRELAFDLSLVAPQLPNCAPPEAGLTEMQYLCQLTWAGAARRYGSRDRNPKAYAQLDHELAMIEALKFPGYFLIVHDIVDFCRQQDIYCQGRGSAANSAVCYALGITNVDSVAWELLFERFLAPERDGPPDIDIDIESDRREEVIQHVYAKYGRLYAAQVANVISYRPRSAVRDIAKAFGFSPGQQDAWSKQIDRWGSIAAAEVEEIPEPVVRYANELQTFPRHLGIHSGGMVICDRPVIEVCPVEWARMADRTVLQWDKDDCASAGLVKFDLLGLGMLSALHYGFDFIESGYDLATMPLDDAQVYAMLCRADSVGVFQVESRAQMATLPRLRPSTFYDLVVEVALIRPGPIQGGSVHPYIRRARGIEKIEYPHPLAEKTLRRTKGVPLFQEQLMQLAIDVAGFTAAEADELRRAMGSKRSMERMARIRDRLYAGMARNGITGALADDFFLKLSAFANYGFPESHAMSFAYLVFASAWLKRYHPAAFCAALLNAQPMGFYSPQTLVDDARRHGVTVLRPDLNASGAKATLERAGQTRASAGGAGEPPPRWGRGGPTVRLGLSQVRTISADLAGRIERERDAHGAYHSMVDLAQRVGLTAPQLEALATAGACDSLGLSRRAALWAAGAAAQQRAGRLPGTVTGVAAPTLPGMDEVDTLIADVWATGLAPDRHPAEFARDHLRRLGALSIAEVGQAADRSRVLVGGVVTHRQRPATAGGITFINLEDETGMLNVTCTPGLWQRHRKVARTAGAMLVRGILEKVEGVLNLRADHLAELRLPIRSASRDFR